MIELKLGNENYKSAIHFLSTCLKRMDKK